MTNHCGYHGMLSYAQNIILSVAVFKIIYLFNFEFEETVYSIHNQEGQARKCN